MPLNRFPGSRVALILTVLCLAGIGLFLLRNPIWRFGHEAIALLGDKERIEAFIASFDWAAPFVFMGMQILQVILAPIPGEATGFIGGYLFGSLKGFIYSSVALAVGSWINFLIGRVLGERYVRRWIRPEKFAKFNRLVRHQGIIVLFTLFIIPGFPKDLLSLFLGVTTLPIKVFVVMVTIGRMPGTLLLSLQGEFLFERNYPLLWTLLGIGLIGAGLTYLFREKIYRWIERSNHTHHSS